MERYQDYRREKAVRYARYWALGRNPKYIDFAGIGGDCTNFVSQSIYAGAGIMNYTPDFGWYYISANDRAAAWTGVEYLYNFLVRDWGGPGPVAVVADEAAMELGDVVQLGDEDGRFYHTLIVTGFEPGGGLLVCAHSIDSLDRPLDTYIAQLRRFLHITTIRRP